MQVLLQVDVIKGGVMMDDIIVLEISKYFHFNLIPFYILLLINIIGTISIWKRKSDSNFVLLLNIFSILANISENYFLGVLLDNQIKVESANTQLIVILFVLVILLFISIFIKYRNKKRG